MVRCHQGLQSAVHNALSRTVAFLSFHELSRSAGRHQLLLQFSRYVLFLTTFGIWFPSACGGILQEPDPAPIIELDERVVLAVENPRYGFQGTVQLGSLPAGRRIRLALKIVNAHEFDFPFDFVEPSCNCGQVYCESREFTAGTTTLLAMDFPVPRKSPDGKYSILLGFREQGNVEPVGTLRVGFSIGGMIAVEQPGVLRPVGEKLTWHLPVRFTAPVTAESLVFGKTEGLRDVDIDLESSDEGQNLVITAKSLVAGQPVVGEVTVECTSARVSDTVQVVIEKSPPVVISPSHIRFRVNRERPQLFSAMVLVRVEPDQLATPETGNPAGNPPATIRGLLGSTELPLTISRIGPAVYRVQIEMEPDSALDGSSQELLIEWSVNLSGISTKLQTPVLFERDQP